MNQVEIIAVVFSLLSVILAVKNNFLTWPVGIVGVIFYGILFYQTKTWGNMYLQFLFLIQSLYGWYNWKKYKVVLPIEKLNKLDTNLFAITTVLLCFIISFILLISGDKQPYLDGVTTGLSIIGTLLLAFKKIDNWYYWITADILYIYLFYSKGLYWSTGIYFVFLLLAISGLKTWKNEKNI
jgi:nicotinamide mononucleotide transporter